MVLWWESLTLQSAVNSLYWRGDKYTTAHAFSFSLAVNVPAEEVMLHQHVLHAFLQRFLLLLLQKGEFDKMRMIIPIVNCYACCDGARSRPPAATGATKC